MLDGERAEHIEASAFGRVANARAAPLPTSKTRAKPTKMYTIELENIDTLLKTIKFEVAQTKSHYMKP